MEYRHFENYNHLCLVVGFGGHKHQPRELVEAAVLALIVSAADYLAVLAGAAE